MSIDKIINKNGTTTYRARTWRKSKTYTSACFRRLKDAKDWESKEKARIIRERYLPERQNKLLFSDVLDNWLKNYASIKKTASSTKKDLQVYKNYVAPFIGNMKACEITASDIDNIISYLSKKTELSNNSINKILQLIKALFNYGIKKRFLIYNPVLGTEFLPVKPLDTFYWSKLDAKSFLEYTENKYKDNDTPYLIYLCALLTGMRAGEIIALKWDAVDFENRLITVKRSTDKVNNTIKETTKSNKIRHIGINDLLSLKLKDHYLNNSKYDLVFTNSSGNIIDFDNFRHRHYLKDINESGVKAIRFHDLRHTFATHYIMNGGTIYDLQRILGHSSTKVTERYAHHDPKHAARTANIVNFSYSTNLKEEK